MKSFITAAKVTLVLVYLVIFAGAAVRMTGSGMGCPDWPKCFGYYIPPTDIKQLTWAPNHEYFEGQVIIKDSTLWVARQDFTSGATYDASQFRRYTKHDYAIFNAKHTWIEYINRLFGALSGLATLIMAVLSVRLWKKDKGLTVLSWFTLGLLVFQAWLGATVVYSVLNPVKITIHMVAALVIVALLLIIIRRAEGRVVEARYNATFRNVLTIAMILSLLQIILGTQVRQIVDASTKDMGMALSNVLDEPTWHFYIHRTFSFVVFFANLFLVLRNMRLNLGYTKLRWLMLMILIEIASGIAMYYFDFPFGSQTIHLVAAAIMFGIQFYLLMESYLAARNTQTEPSLTKKAL